MDDAGRTEGRLARSAGLAGAATLASRVLGLARESLQAALFGAGNDVDAFLIAFRIPNLARDLFAEGTMSAAFVPTFTKYLTLRGKPDAWRLANNVLTTLAVVSGVLVVLGMIFAGPLVSFYAGRYADVPGKLELTISLTRIMLPFMTFVAIAAAMMGMLNSLQHYFVPALSPAMFNVVTIVCMVAVVPLMPGLGLPRVWALAIGVVLGGLGQAAVQWPSLRREGFRFQPSIDLRDEGLQRIFTLIGPGTFGLAATQVNIFINSLLATQQGTGAVSWLTYAFRLMYFPLGLFGVSIATAVLPRASRDAATGDYAGMGRTVSRGLGLMLAINIPATLGLIVLAEPIVRVLFERGRFTPADTLATAAALRFYAIGLVGYAGSRIISPVFYALGRSRTPVVVSVMTVVVSTAASLVLVRFMGFRGLALATSIAALAHGAVLVWLIRGPLEGIDTGRLGATLVKSMFASLAMAGAAWAAERWLAAHIGRGGLAADTAVLGAAIVTGLGVLTLAAKALGIREFDEALTVVTRRAGETREN